MPDRHPASFMPRRERCPAGGTSGSNPVPSSGESGANLIFGGESHLAGGGDQRRDAAEARRCDLIVMASHGRRGVAAVVLGSETVKVLTHSKIPVLVYR